MLGKVVLERTRRDVQMLSLMYAEVLKNMEIAKFTLDNQTPFFQVVDKPTLPLEKKKVSRIISAIVGSIILGIVFCIYLISKNFKKNILPQ
jgi:capsule polysaccharide export protein KpsE/RkpR